MSKRLAIPVLVLAALLVAGTLLSIFRWREPSYRGVKLKDWLISYDNSTPAWQTDEAVRAMGKPALPFLVEMLEATDSNSKRALIELAEDFDIRHGEYVPAEKQRRRALGGLRALGPEAKSAVALLMSALRKDETRKGAALALGAIGSAGMTPLTQALSDSQAENRAAAAMALGECVSPIQVAMAGGRTTEEAQAINVGANAALPSLIRCLKDVNPQVRAAAAAALGDFMISPEMTLPALVETLKDNDSTVRRAAAVALGRYRTAADSASPALIPLLQDPEPSVQAGAGLALRLIDPENAEQVGAK